MYIQYAFSIYVIIARYYNYYTYLFLSVCFIVKKSYQDYMFCYEFLDSEILIFFNIKMYDITL